MDVIDEVHAVVRTVGLGVLPAGPARIVTLTRVLAAEIEDVWGAITDADELSTWFLPTTGDLRVGGRYELEGNATGEIRRCDGPHLIEVTWLFGGVPADVDSSIVTARLAPIGRCTRIQFEHVAVVPDDAWREFGPGAVGVGWDLTLLGLAGYVTGEQIGNVDDLSVDPGMRDMLAASSQAWGEAHQAGGASPQEATAAVAATTAFYVPPMEA